MGVASLDDTNNALTRLRNSKLNLLNAIYAATVRLVVSSYYLIPSNQASTGYPGPPKKISGPLPEVDEPADPQEAL